MAKESQTHNKVILRRMAAKDDYWSYVETIYGIDNEIKELLKSMLVIHIHKKVRPFVSLSGSLEEGAYIPRSIANPMTFEYEYDIMLRIGNLSQENADEVLKPITEKPGFFKLKSTKKLKQSIEIEEFFSSMKSTKHLRNVPCRIYRVLEISTEQFSQSQLNRMSGG